MHIMMNPDENNIIRSYRHHRGLSSAPNCNKLRNYA